MTRTKKNADIRPSTDTGKGAIAGKSMDAEKGTGIGKSADAIATRSTAPHDTATDPALDAAQEESMVHAVAQLGRERSGIDDPLEFVGGLRGARRMASPLTESVVAKAAEDFHARRADIGLVEADGAWFDDPVNEWMNSLDFADPKLSPEGMLHIAAGTRETLSMRDAMLVSVLAPITRTDMQRLASAPHDVKSAKTVYDALNSVFRDPTAVPDSGRCATGLKLFALLVRSVPRRDRAHPLACVAYICWWLGFLDESRRCAQESLDIDPSCSLASIIMTATQFEVLPAWADCAIDERNAMAGI